MLDERYDQPARQIPPELPFWEREVTLGEVRGGVIRFATAKCAKSEFLERRKDAVLFVAWTGNWCTDIFAVTEKDVELFYEQTRREEEKRASNRKAEAAIRKAERYQ